MIIENVFLLALIAAILTADMTSFGQFMLCRPIFAAPIFGYLTGDITTGLWLGMIIEMVWINAVPLGASIPPDICAISVLSVYWANANFTGLSSAAMWALAFAVPFGYLCRDIDIAGRKINTKIMHWVERGIEMGIYTRVNKAIAAGLFLFVFRFFLFYVVIMSIGGKIYSLLYLLMPVFVLDGFTKAWFILPLLGLSCAVYSFASMKIPSMRK
jgi:mannose/fructose/N-acetylgalactosamine-specific phosphotransferase system component IIC